jgi:uncharacterized protein YybS (DUF2232 family)
VKNTRRLTEGAILLAAFAVILLITFYVPVFGMVASLFLPLPFMLFAAKNDWKGTIVFVVASLLLSLVFGSILSLPLTLASSTTGAVMGVQINRKKSKLAICVSGFFVFLANSIIMYGVSIIFFNQDIMQQSINLLRDSIKSSTDMLNNLGQGAEAKKAADQFNQALSLMKTLIPSMFVFSSAFMVLVTQAISFPILKKFGIKVENFKPFREIILPKSLLWYFLVIMSISLFVHPGAGTFWQMALLNLTFIIFFLMIFQGLSFMFFVFHQKGISKSVSILIAIISFIIPIVLYIVGILGIMDLGFDLRKRFEK